MRTRRVLLFLAAFLVMVGVSPVAFAGGPQPSAGPVAAKACASAPSPAKPSNGLPGMFYPKPSSASTGDPFTDPGVTIADVYGYSYKWQTYDTGCLPGSDQLAGGMTGIANSTLAVASAVNAVTHQEFSLVIEPTWLGPLDDALRDATASLRRGFFTPWLTPVLLLVAVAVLWAASRADISSAVTTSGWAILVLVATTYVMNYPVASAHAVDDLVQMTVTTAAQGTVEPPVPYAPDQIAPGQEGSLLAGPSVITPAQRAMNAQMDAINRNTLYAGWLMGTFGSATSHTAITYGPHLFRASHLSWAEAEQVEAGNGGQILADKKQVWEDTAARIREVDPGAYGYVTGNNGRWEAMFTVWMSIVTTMPFLIVAGVLVIVAYGAIRLVIPMAPALGVFGMLMPLRGWMLGVVTRAARFIAMGPLFWAGSLANLFFLTAIFSSDLAFALKYVLAFTLPILLFSLLMPRKNGALGKIGRLMRSATAQARNRRGSKKPPPPDDKGKDGSSHESRKGQPASAENEDSPTDAGTEADREPSRTFTPAPSPEPGRPPRLSQDRRQRHDLHKRSPHQDPDRPVSDHGRDHGRNHGPQAPGHHEPLSPDEPRRGLRPTRVPLRTPAPGEDLTEPAPPGYSPFGVTGDSPVIVDGENEDRWVAWIPPEYANDQHARPTRTPIGV
jgi:hypothetical protein